MRYIYIYIYTYNSPRTLYTTCYVISQTLSYTCTAPMCKHIRIIVTDRLPDRTRPEARGLRRRPPSNTGNTAAIHIHLCTNTYIYIYIHTYIHTYIHSYIHTYIHTYIHITSIIREATRQATQATLQLYT